MTGLLLAVLGVLGMTALGDMVSEEVRDRLDHLPHAILRLAARMLDPAKRAAIYEDEWLPELTYILKGDEARPVTRLFIGAWYALGILLNTYRIARHLHRPAPQQPGDVPASPFMSGGYLRPIPAGLGTFLAALAGARLEILVHCPSERTKFQSLGGAMLMTAGVATASTWFALSSAMGVNGIIATVPALLGGLTIVGIDRWLITSLPHDGVRRLLMAMPRLFMAMVMGTLISTPLMLRVFQTEINAQIAVIKEQRYDAFLVWQQHGAVGMQVSYWTRQVADLQRVVDTGGAQPLNPAVDPQVRALTKLRTSELALQGQYFKQWQCQLDGVYQGVKCPRGNGPLAKASENGYNQAKAQVAQLTSGIGTREQQLAASDVASQKLRYGQARTALPNALAQLNIAQGREDSLQTAFNTQNAALNGILIRLQALSQLSNDNYTLTSAKFLVFLLFLVVEILPVTVKLLQPSGSYEAILAAITKRELATAHMSYRQP
jgi:hypothetical protein